MRQRILGVGIKKKSNNILAVESGIIETKTRINTVIGNNKLQFLSQGILLMTDSEFSRAKRKSMWK